MVSVDEIEKNDFDLNIPRYIDSQEAEDIQDVGSVEQTTSSTVLGFEPIPIGSR
jgi:hypothetical protein